MPERDVSGVVQRQFEGDLFQFGPGPASKPSDAMIGGTQCQRLQRGMTAGQAANPVARLPAQRGEPAADQNLPVLLHGQ